MIGEGMAEEVVVVVGQGGHGGDVVDPDADAAAVVAWQRTSSLSMMIYGDPSKKRNMQ